MKQVTPSCRMPEGISRRTVFLPLMTSVWPALWPPWKRTTPATRSVSRSTILPLPSSPHWAPITTTFRFIDSCERTHAADEIEQQRHRRPCWPAPTAAAARRRDRQRLSTRFMAWGLRNGRTPSSTRYSANAASRSDQFIAPLSAQRRVGTLQVLEELAVGRDHQHVAVGADRLVDTPAGCDGTNRTPRCANRRCA